MKINFLQREIGWMLHLYITPHFSHHGTNITILQHWMFKHLSLCTHVSVWVDSSHLCFQLGYFEPLLVGFSFQGQAVHVGVRTLEFFTLQLVTHTWSI